MNRPEPASSCQPKRTFADQMSERSEYWVRDWMLMLGVTK
jgi:hypothetical protein